MAFAPIDAAKSCVRRAKRMLLTVEASLPDTRVRNDLRRMALVMAVAGLDAYLHARVLRQSSNWHSSSALPAAWQKLDIPIQELAQMARATVRSRNEGRMSRPWTQVRNALQRRILKMPFQSPDQVAVALSLCGIKKAWQKVASGMGVSAKDCRRRLDGVVLRRNQIVHEGDFARLVRPRSLRLNRVSSRSFSSDVDWLEKLISAIDQVTT